MSVNVTSVIWRALQYRARVLTSGLAALAHSTQWLPTFACTRQSVHAHRPQRVQRRPASAGDGGSTSRAGSSRCRPGRSRGWGQRRHGWRKGYSVQRCNEEAPGRRHVPVWCASPRCSYSRSHGMGFRDRTRVPGEARLDGDVRPGRDHPARDARRGLAQRRRVARRFARSPTRSRRRSSSRACGPPTCRPTWAASASAR